MSPRIETSLNGNPTSIELDIDGNASGYRYKDGSFEINLAPGSVEVDALSEYLEETVNLHNLPDSSISLELTPDNRGDLKINSMDVFVKRVVEVPKGSTIKVTLLDGTGL